MIKTARTVFSYAFIAIICFLGTFLLVYSFEQREIKIQKNNFLSRVKILASTIDLADIQSLTGYQRDAEKRSYQRIQKQLTRVIRSNPKLRYAYIMGKRDDEIIFLAENISDDISEIGEIYYEASEELRSLFEGGEGFVEGPLADRWGNWVSALVPIKDPKTKDVIAILGLDIDASIWEKDVAYHRYYGLIMAFIFLLVVLVSIILNRRWKIMNRRLQKSERRFIHVANGSGDWIWETDMQGQYTYSSPAIKDILGYKANEIIGKKYFYDFCFPQDQDDLKRKAQEQYKKQVTHFEEIEKRQHKDGHEVILHIKGFAVFDRKGNMTGYRGVDRDITEERIKQRALENATKDLEINEQALRALLKDMERTNKELKNTQDKLIQTEKMATIGTFSAGIAHEIKNPLAIIMQGLERIEKDIQKGKTFNDTYLTIIRNAAVRANQVISTMLKFSRSAKTEMHAVDIHQVARQALELVNNRIRDHAISIHLGFVQEKIKVWGDPVLLQQAFLDLMENAVDAMLDGGTLTIKSWIVAGFEGEPGEISMEFKDTGLGIPQENIPRIFDAFFTTKEVGRGTGLGLSTVYLIIERHNGRISVKSEEGKGTTFTIILPLTVEE